MFDGADYKGRRFREQMQPNHLISLAKSLFMFRIRDQDMHDQLFELALKSEPAEKDHAFFFNYLLLCAARLPTPHNYEQVKHITASKPES